jgi:hypothetical protein
MPLDPDHIFDPDGDVTLMLQDEIPPFAVWNSSNDDSGPVFEISPAPVDGTFDEIPPAPGDDTLDEIPPALEDGTLDEFPEALPPVDHVDNDSSLEIRPNSDEDDGVSRLDISNFAQDESEHSEPHYSIEMKVSSRHLILASPVFKKMLKGQWHESAALLSRQPVQLPIEDWDADAMCILMNIIHGKTRRVPRSIDLIMLAKMSVLVNYYDCLEVVDLFSNMWIRDLEKSMPKTYCKDLILWILISHVFRRARLFKTATHRALEYSTGPLQTMGLPIPARVIGESKKTLES